MNQYPTIGARKPKDPVRRAAGWENRRNGLKLESIISNACELYAEQGIALIEKTPEPMRPIQKLDKGRFIAIHTEKAQCDFKGTLKGGQAIAFEAKSTQNDRILQSVITDRQWNCLTLHESLGAKCCVVVSLLNGTAFYRVPWAVWTGMKEAFGHKYMNTEDLKPYVIPTRYSKGKICLMFLEKEN